MECGLTAVGELRAALKEVVGRLAEIASPQLSREIDEARNPARARALKRAILYARLRRAQSAGDVAAIERALAAYWKGDSGDRFHDRYTTERFDLFRQHHAVALEAFVTFATNHPGVAFSRLVEIGCGDGNVLGYCAGRLTGLSEFVGLDINQAVIARNASRQPLGGSPQFFCAEAGDWLQAHPSAGTVVLSNAGVLEYLSQSNFDRLLATLGRDAPAAIVLIEPVAPTHDLQGGPDSFAFGHENSFSHNHRVRLTNAGFDIVFEQQQHLANARWMLMVGVRT